MKLVVALDNLKRKHKNQIEKLKGQLSKENVQHLAVDPTEAFYVHVHHIKFGN